MLYLLIGYPHVAIKQGDDWALANIPALIASFSSQHSNVGHFSQTLLKWIYQNNVWSEHILAKHWATILENHQQLYHVMHIPFKFTHL